jgi:NADPH:quinone reductase-like Zn-dependent oxidoreductase
MIQIPKCMAAVQLWGHGGFDRLRYSETVPVPDPAAGEMLIRVAAAGVNNTDINTRIGWYAPDAKQSTEEALHSGLEPEVGDWSGSGLTFPRIQGADVCGYVVKVGKGVHPSRLGARVIVQSCLRSLSKGGFTPWLGSERDGAFAQFVCAPDLDAYPVQCDLSDAELAAVPCAYGTAENLISRAHVTAGETVVITGASGNVGLAAIQLAKRRGAQVIAVAAPEKFGVLESVGADRCIARGADLVDALQPNSLDVVIDVVGGPQWPRLLEVLKLGGRYAVSGAIAGPLVELDLRKLYLKDLTLFGCTSQGADVFPNLIGYLERNEIRPLVSREYALRDIVAAQEDFLSKQRIGKIVLIPPAVTG